MKTFGRYFVYRLKQSALRTVVFTLLSLVLCLSVVGDCISVQSDIHKSTGLYILATVLGILCTLIPILELSGFKNRRNLDTLYFFPIKRTKMALAHYLSGALQVFVIYTVSFLSVWLYLAVKTECFRLEYMPLYYIFSLLIGAIMYSIFSFLFGEANTVADGVLFCGLWVFVISLVMVVGRAYILKPLIFGKDIWTLTTDFSGWGIIYAPINNLTVIFQDAMEVQKQSLPYDYNSRYADIYLSQMYMFFVWGAVGIAATVGYFITFNRKGAHLTGEISSSIFGYKLLIPLYGYSLLLMFSDLDDIMVIITFALMLIGYFVYRRGFKIKPRDIVFIACGIVPVILGQVLQGIN